jgi:hypothetical protein
MNNKVHKLVLSVIASMFVVVSIAMASPGVALAGGGGGGGTGGTFSVTTQLK